MKSLDELKKNPQLLIGRLTIDGGNGTVKTKKWSGTVIWSNGGGWEHVSVAPYKRNIVPSWDDMCMIKDMFFEDNETVVQYHPAKSNYVNVLENCLHLWRPIDRELPVPPMILV